MQDPSAHAERPAPTPVRFSEIIVTKERPRALRAALESSARALPADAELIVVDGDPQGSAAQVVREVQQRYPDVDMRCLPSAPGITRQRNLGIDAAVGEVVVFVDDDCTFEPGLFEALADAYRDATVVGACVRIDHRAPARLGNNRKLRRLVLGGGRQGSMSSFGFRRPIVDVEQPRDVEFMPGPLMSARREVAAQVRFDEQLGGYGVGEDDDFSYRVSRRGRIRYEPAALVYHHALGQRGMEQRRLDRLMVANRAYLLRKNFSHTRRARAGFAVLLAILCVHRVLNREWAGLRGLLEGIGDAWRSGALRPGVRGEPAPRQPRPRER